jgi:NAD(P)-dependent dehydrogenase (short-subunit alcohol dehydrogenase family)
MGTLQDRVVIVTGAGRGIGREHALLFAAEGAKVVVNDLGGATDGTGASESPAHEVVLEIEAAGGQAVASTHDVASSAGGDALVQTALDAFGDLHALVNNAGILRDRTLANMTDEDWETSIRVNLSGTFYPARAAARYWREKSKSRGAVDGAIVNTSSESGIFANAGQGNYAAAKAGVAALIEVWHKELGRYGVRVNGICPRAATRLTAQVGVEDKGPEAPWHPSHVSPWVAYLISRDCPISGQVFVVVGGRIQRVAPWSLDESWKIDDRLHWEPHELPSRVEALGLPTNTGRVTPFNS